MRLIDADKLLEYGACPNDCNGTTTCAEDCEHLHCPVRVFDIESINDTPTVKAIPIDKIQAAKEEIREMAFTNEIFDEDVFNSTYTDSTSRQTAECESWVEAEVVRMNDVLAILDRLISESEN
jgi:hypothetical protein